MISRTRRIDAAARTSEMQLKLSAHDRPAQIFEQKQTPCPVSRIA
jgi:hypothetical protein